jgi:hypothetical protein
MSRVSAKKIPLSSWQDPQGDVVLIYSEFECSIFFACWVQRGVPADYVCLLSFTEAVATRSFPREYTPYEIEPSDYASYVLEVTDSPWLHEQKRERKRLDETVYRHNPGRPWNARHFVVTGHDIYHEILAASYMESRIYRADITDPRLLALIDAP